jgi:hypothetical protein
VIVVTTVEVVRLLLLLLLLMMMMMMMLLMMMTLMMAVCCGGVTDHAVSAALLDGHRPTAHQVQTLKHNNTITTQPAITSQRHCHATAPRPAIVRSPQAIVLRRYRQTALVSSTKSIGLLP